MRVSERMELVETALGRKPYDLVIRNLNLVNVSAGEIRSGAIGIKHGRVVHQQVPAGAETAQTFDAGGRYALPGFIDTHVHIDSTLLRPEQLAALIVPHGTTAVFADPMEIANIAGQRGIESLLHARQSLPYHLYVEVPSRVPTAPGLETTGAELGVEAVEALLHDPAAISLGELDPSKVIGLREPYFEKLAAAHARGKIANGHSIGLAGDALSAYVSAGLSDDHESVTFEEAQERIRLGMAVLVREGSTERNLEALLKGLIRTELDTRHWMMCTDDKHPDDILHEGHIDYMVRKAIKLGLPAMHAVQMATLNAAEHFRLDHEIGSLSPGRYADIVLCEDLERLQVSHVFFAGRLVAQDGSLVEDPPNVSYPAWLRKTVHLQSGLSARDFNLPAKGKRVQAHVLKVFPDQIINEDLILDLPVRNNQVGADLDQDALKLAVVERHGKNGNIGLAFASGFGLRCGALSSTVAHDHHNLIIVGADEGSMATCVRATQDMQGGLVVADGEQVLAQLALPLGGLLSDESAPDVITALQELNRAAAALGCTLPAPFMTLSFVSLPTVPELGMTDMGLVDVARHALMPTIIAVT